MAYRFGIYLLVFHALFCCSVFAQKTIKGRIIDAISREPVEYASICSLENSICTQSDKNGSFQFMFKGDSLQVQFRSIGYKITTVTLHASSNSIIIPIEKGPVDLKEVTILSNANNAGFHNISGIDLNLRPVNSAQDLMRLVPGLFLGQHQGGGIAEHIFLRGFDADHGTDVNVSVDGMPLNLPSHIHGQGFADLHFLIPELVSRYEFGKGPYYTDKGDFTTTGYVSFHTIGILEKSEVKMEVGQFHTARLMSMINLLDKKALSRGQSAYIAGEASYTDGPFVWPQHFNRFNLFGKYNQDLSTKSKISLTLSTFSSDWRSSGEIPERAVEAGLISRFGYIDSAQGGHTTRTTAIIKLNTSLRNQLNLENEIYYARYYFNLNYNASLFAEDSINGDQRKQHESRDLFGYTGKLNQHVYFRNGSDLGSSIGVGFQIDQIDNSELSHTIHYNDVLDYIQLGNIKQSTFNIYLDENYHLGKWLFNGGIRLDYFYFNYLDRLNPVNPSVGKSILSPKVNIEYTFDNQFQIYLKTGRGFHSNDAKVVTYNKGNAVLPPAYGTDLGINWKPISNLYINAAIWYLQLAQELVYDGDEGVFSPGGRTGREGFDFSARYQINSWLFANLDINYCNARALDEPKGNNYLPLSVPLSSSGGLDFKLKSGINGGLSYRYMKDRPANEDNSMVAQGYFVTDLTANYTRPKYEIGIEIQNLLNTKWREAQFEVDSRLKSEPAPVEDISYTAGTPFFLKIKFAVFF